MSTSDTDMHSMSKNVLKWSADMFHRTAKQSNRSFSKPGKYFFGGLLAFKFKGKGGKAQGGFIFSHVTRMQKSLKTFLQSVNFSEPSLHVCTEFLSQLRAKLRDWAVRPVGAGCYSWAAFSFIHSQTRYMVTNGTLCNSSKAKMS